MGILDRSESRRGATVIWLAVHSTEGNDVLRADDASALRDAAWWTGSSHAICDNEVLLTPAEGCVPYDRAAWTLRSGNRISENIEQVGWARWTRDEWLAHPGTLDGTARWLADRSKARGIPLVRLSLADIRARKPGVIGHGDYTAATGDGTHTDPGPNYPWDYVLDLARGYAGGDDLTAQFETDVRADLAMKQKQLNVIVDQLTGGGHTLNADLRADLAVKGRTIDALVALVAQQNGLNLDDVRRVVAEEVAKGVAVDVTVGGIKPGA